DQPLAFEPSRQLVRSASYHVRVDPRLDLGEATTTHELPEAGRRLLVDVIVEDVLEVVVELARRLTSTGQPGKGAEERPGDLAEPAVRRGVHEKPPARPHHATELDEGGNGLVGIEVFDHVPKQDAVEG